MSGCIPTTRRARGIADGDRVRVFNDRGATCLPVKVTTRIAPGVVSIKEGAWFTPDANGTDTGGCANVLTDDRSAPCGATTYNTNLVEVELARVCEFLGQVRFAGGASLQ